MLDNGPFRDFRIYAHNATRSTVARVRVLFPLSETGVREAHWVDDSDSTSQYDAIRAYLKELDITDNVWIGLSKTPEKPDFTWTNFQPLTGEGHWQEAITPSSNPLCVAMDPARDFLWKPMTCGGPEVASFICELPIPSWALGPRGCLLTELPSLTVLYIPEQSSLELTSDCGLDGTKRIACKGDADREEILKQLTCAIPHDDFDDKSTKPPGTFTSSFATAENSLPINKPTKTPMWTSNTIDIDYGMPTRHRRETEDTLSAGSTTSTVTSMHTAEKMAVTAETFTATNYDTEVTTSSLLGISTIDPTTLKSSSSEFLASRSTEAATTDNVTPIIELAQTSTTVSTADSRNVFSETIEKDISAEYPGAISQGQLFSIIENGTMFDIIELNQTSERELRTEATAPPEQKTKLKPSTKLAQLAEKNPKNLMDAKNKPLTKKDIYKNSDPKKNFIKKNNSKTDEIGDINKEVEIFPIINDPSLKLNRTFRKDLPKLAEPESNNSKESSPSEQEVAAASKPNGTKVIDIKLVDNLNQSRIDPNIDLLNADLKADNDSEIIEDFEKKIKQSLKKQLMQNSPLGEEDKNELVDTEPKVTEASMQSDDEIHQKPNRQRQLTRPQKRPFYPYFFSRVLG
ncbi:hypothetical protein JTB14_038244 [Gonioctena quinquepunctata]|nr:hypothetical protein JTB14_038244 [Gonioctena quinquepunctata]